MQKQARKNEILANSTRIIYKNDLECILHHLILKSILPGYEGAKWLPTRNSFRQSVDMDMHIHNCIQI